jgi:RHS repeat-associated protein
MRADHDAAGNLTTRTDARGKTATYRYDSLNRISDIAYDDDTVRYTWDSCTNGIGRLCSVSNAASSLSYRYDPHGRITQKTQTSGGAPLNVSHSYNAAGLRIQTVTPGGQTLDYQWNGGRLAALSVNGQPVLSQITYEPDGPVNGWVWGNNQPSERFYDLTGRPVIISLGFDSQSQQPSSRTLGYDAAGRLTDVLDDSNPQLNQRHGYDGLDRLISSERGEFQLSRTDYGYDLNGNRTEKSQDNTTPYSYSIDPGSNRLQSQSGAQAANYNYDATGSLTGNGTISYTYNAAGRRISATAANLKAGYTYNALGQRIAKTVNGITTQYAYDEQGHLTGEYDSAGHLLQETVWLGDLPVAVLEPATPANQTTSTIDLYYLHADHLGTPRKITRPEDNKVVWTWESEAFGNSLPDQNPSGLGNFVFNLRFPGQYYDQETGLFYNGFRDYDPGTGRYSESDPIGLNGGINTYGYVNGNPVNYTDPLGLLVVINGTNPRATSILDEAYRKLKKLKRARNFAKNWKILTKSTL